MAKNGQVHEGGRVGRSSATPTKLFSVDSYDLKSMSLKFGNDIFTFTFTFEMLRSSFTMIFWKINFVTIPSIFLGVPSPQILQRLDAFLPRIP